MALHHKIGAAALAAAAAATFALMPTADAAVSPLAQGEAAAPDALSIGGTLTEGQAIVSAGQALGFVLILQKDGNLVEYATTSERVIWASGTHGTGNRLVFQDDHNVVLYSADNKVLWSTLTQNTAATKLIVATNGQLIVANSELTKAYYHSTTAGAPAGAAVIAELVAPNKHYGLVLQDDGNMVVYYIGGDMQKAIWSSQTNGHPRSELILEPNGQLVIFAADNKVLWATKTAGHAGARLEMQSDGNLVLYSGNKAIWATHTVGKK